MSGNSFPRYIRTTGLLPLSHRKSHCPRAYFAPGSHMNSADDVNALLKARAKIDEQLRKHKNTLTVLFTDVVGSTSFFERNGDTAGVAMIFRHEKLAKSVVQQHKGRIIKTIGDSAMAEFPDPSSAVRAAVEIERQ